MSVGKICDNGYKVVFKKNSAYVVSETGEVKTVATRHNDLYYVKERNESAVNEMFKTNILKWHERFGHLNEQSLKELMKNNKVLGLKFDCSLKLPCCETCIRSEQT